jgi:hypothetical protein
MLQVFQDSRPFEQAMDSTAIYGYRMRGRAYYFQPVRQRIGGLSGCTTQRSKGRSDHLVLQ